MEPVITIMRKKMNTALIGILLTLSLSSCRQEMECAGFDLADPIMDWYFVPGLEEEIFFTDSNSTTYAFNQTNYWMTETETISCGGCVKCYCLGTRLMTTYNNSNLDITFDFSTQSSFGSLIELTHDSTNYIFDVDLTNDSLYSFDSLYTVTPLDTFIIFNTTITDVFEITSQIEDFKFWLKKDTGILAFEKNAILYKRN